MLNLAKNTKPTTSEVIRVVKGNETLFFVITYKYASRETENIMLIELHPIQRIQRFGDRDYIESLKTTDIGNCCSNRFFLNLDTRDKTASFGPRLCISLDGAYQGFGLATYMFSQLIAWGKANAPTYTVRIGKLSLADAQREGNKERRNRFYTNFGFVIDPPDADEGTLNVDCMGSLREHYNPEKIKAIAAVVAKTETYPFFDAEAVRTQLS